MSISPRSKNAWSYTSTPQYAFMAWRSVKKQHRDNFTFSRPISSLPCPNRLQGPTQLPVQRVTVVRQPEHEANHYPPSSAQVKNERCDISTITNVLMAWFFVKHRIRLHGVVLSKAQGRLYRPTVSKVTSVGSEKEYIRNLSGNSLWSTFQFDLK
jgi:hypothetical protein